MATNQTNEQNHAESYETQLNDPKVMVGATLGNSFNQKKVVASSAYQQARSLFEQESDQKWLQRLIAIVNSVPTYTAQSPISALFNKQELFNKNTEAVSMAIQQIQQLIAEYQSFKNSLPEEQAEQLGDAGLNPLTHQFGASSIGNSVAPATVGTPATTPSHKLLGTLISSALDISSGLLSFGKAMFDMKITEDSSFIDNATKLASLANNGIILDSSHFPGKYKGLIEFINNSPGPTASNEGRKVSYKTSKIQSQFLSEIQKQLSSPSFIDDRMTCLQELAALNVKSLEVGQSRSISEDQYYKEYYGAADATQRAAAENDKARFESEHYAHANGQESGRAFNAEQTLKKHENEAQLELDQAIRYQVLEWMKRSKQGALGATYMLLRLRTGDDFGGDSVVETAGNIVEGLVPDFRGITDIVRTVKDFKSKKSGKTRRR